MEVRIYRIPLSRRAFCRMVSLTAAKTSRICVRRADMSTRIVLNDPNHRTRTFEVSVAWVRWGYTLNLARLVWVNLQRIYLAALLMSEPPNFKNKARQSDSGTAWLTGSWLTSVFGEIFFKRSLCQFHLEDIDLVEEQDDRSTQEPSRVDDWFKEYQRFLHTILIEDDRISSSMHRTSSAPLRTWPLSSSRTWSYSLKATQKMIEVTASKQWIH